jgi:hypothetical protein
MSNVQITRSSSAPTSTTLYVRALNACGEGSTKNLGTLVASSYPSYYSMTAYPNPAGSTLTVAISIDAQAHAQASAQVSSAKTVRETPVFDILLYDGNGTLRRQTSSHADTATVDVSGLPEGIYYLHVLDDTGENPAIQQIIVRR